MHFAPNTDLDVEEGELDEFLKKQKENPKKYLADYDSTAIGWGCLDGKQVVYGCPCNLASKYEEFIWNHREIIAEYFSNKAQKMQKESQQAKNLANKLQRDIESLR